MRRTMMLVIAALACVLFTSTAALAGQVDKMNRCWHLKGGPAAHRDLCKDFVEGMHFYEYERSNPVVYLDPTGQWTIDRNGQTLAPALAEKDDTIEKLADKIGLNANEFQKWLTIEGGKIRTPKGMKTLPQLNEKDVCCPGEKVKIPNVILAYWGGEFGGVGKVWVEWDKDVGTLTQRGFHVAKNQGWTSAQLESVIQEGTATRTLQGIFFWGHGWRGGVLTDSGQKGKPAYESWYANWNPNYRLGLGVLFACYGQSGRGQFSNSKAIVFWGKTGVLIPGPFHSFAPTMRKLVPPGAQGTKK